MAARMFPKTPLRFAALPLGASFKCANGVVNVKISQVLATCLTFDRKSVVKVGFHPDEKVMLLNGQVS